MDFVSLQGGLVVPEDVLVFALALEARGVVLETKGEALKVKGPAGKPDLSELDVQFIKARKAHLVALAGYRAPTESSQQATD